MATIAAKSAMPTRADKKKVVLLLLALVLMSDVGVVPVGSGPTNSVVMQFVFVCGVVAMQVKVVVGEPWLSEGMQITRRQAITKPERVARTTREVMYG